MLKLNLGCGIMKLPDYVNVDMEEGCAPEVLHDLTQAPWPWDDNTVEEANFELSLEQMGENRKEFLTVIKELYRVCAPDAKVNIVTLHPRHDSFVMNPLCLHPLGPEFIASLSIAQNMQMIASGVPGDYMGLRLGVNFEVVKADFLFSPEFEGQFKEGSVTEEELRKKLHIENNVCHGIRYQIKVLKK